MIQIEAPDGTIVEFPAGTSDDVIANAMRQEFGGPKQQGTFSGVVDAVTQGAALGFGDEITAFESALLGRTPEGGWFDYQQPFGERYSRNLQAERQQQDQFAEDNPVTSTAAEIAGSVGTGAGAARAGLTLMGRASGLRNTAAAGAEGAAYAGIYGAGSADEGDRLQAAGEGAAFGALTGAALERVIGAFAKNRASKQARKQAPTIDQLKQEADALYEAADRTGEVISTDQLKDFTMRSINRMDEMGLDVDLHRPVYRSLQRMLRSMEDNPQGLGFKQVENLRKFISRNTLNATGDSAGETRRLGAALVDDLDDFVEGAANNMGQTAKAAREAYRRKSQSELLERFLQDEAERQAAVAGSGGNVENAMRQRANRLLNNRRLSRGLSDDVKEELRKVASGDNSQNLKRLIGKLSPEGNGLRLALYVVGAGLDPITAGAVAGAGALSKRSADAGVRRAVDDIQTLVRTGQPMGATPPQRVNPGTFAPLIGSVVERDTEQ